MKGRGRDRLPVVKQVIQGDKRCGIGNIVSGGVIALYAHRWQ